MLDLKPDKLLTYDEFRNILVGGIISLIIIIVLIYKYATKNNEFVCDNYVLNSYLYSILAFVCLTIIGVSVVYYGVLETVLGNVANKGLFGFIMFFGLIFGAIFVCSYYLRTLEHDRQVLLHIIFLILIALLGLISFYVIIIAHNMNILYPALLFTLIMTVIVGLVGYNYGDQLISYDFEKYLSYALIGYILILIVGPFFINNPNTLDMFYYVMTIASLIIFTLLLLVHNKKLKENEKKCEKPNYPLEGYSLFIKIYNILLDIIELLSRRKGKKRMLSSVSTKKKTSKKLKLK